MKNFLLLIFVIALFNSAFAQVELEQTYFEDNDGSYRFLTMQDIGNNEYKYILTQRGIYGDSLILLYNLNHSLFQKIIIPNISGYHNYIVPVFGSIAYTSNSDNTFGMFLSRYLFDSDEDIEYAVKYSNDPFVNIGIFNIYNIDGSIVKTINNFNYSKGIFFDENRNRKLIVINENSGGEEYFEVYSLGGTIPSKTITINSKEENLKLYNAYPNPSDGTYTIKYELPKNIESAEIVFYSLTGVELKRYTVDNNFNTLIVDNAEFPKGTYIYKLITSDNISKSKKVIQK